MRSSRGLGARDDAHREVVEALLRELKVLDPVGIVHDQRLAQIVRVNHATIGKREHVEHAALHAPDRGEWRAALALRRALHGDVADAEANERHGEGVERRDDHFAALARATGTPSEPTTSTSTVSSRGVERTAVRALPCHEIALVASVLIAHRYTQSRLDPAAQLRRERLRARERERMLGGETGSRSSTSETRASMFG